MAASLMLIDEDPSTVGQLRPILEQDGYRVIDAMPGLAAIRTILVDEPDLVILGVNCHEGGWKFCKRLLSILGGPLLVLLCTCNPMDQVRGLELGADDCMIRPVSTIEFLARVRALLRRQDLTNQGEQRGYFVDGDLIVDAMRQEVWRNGQPVALTPTEFRLLCCFTQHVGQVLSHGRLTKGTTCARKVRQIQLHGNFVCSDHMV